MDEKGLAGLSALVSTAIEILKNLNAIPDGKAGLAAAIGNIAVYAVMVLGQLYEVDLQRWDAVAEQLVVLIGMVAGSYLTHKLGRSMKLPLFDK